MHFMYEQLIMDEDEGKLQFKLYKCIYYFPVPSRPLVFFLSFFLFYLLGLRVLYCYF